MLNHETDVIGNSQNVKKMEQCHRPELFSFTWHCHYLESFFSGAQNCLGDTAGLGIWFQGNLPPKFLWTFLTSRCFISLQQGRECEKASRISAFASTCWVLRAFLYILKLASTKFCDWIYFIFFHKKLSVNMNDFFLPKRYYCLILRNARAPSLNPGHKALVTHRGRNDGVGYWVNH